MIPLFLFAEDILSCRVASRIVRTVDEDCIFDIQLNKPTGNGQLKSGVSKYINLARTFPVLLVARFAPKDLKHDILPAKKAKSKVGIGYNQRLVEYVESIWNPTRATMNSDSLKRSLCRLEQLRDRLALKAHYP